MKSPTNTFLSYVYYKNYMARQYPDETVFTYSEYYEIWSYI